LLRYKIIHFINLSTYFDESPRYIISQIFVQWQHSCSMRTDGRTWRSYWLPFAS